MRGVFVILLLSFLCAGRFALAQEAAEIEAPQASASGEAYLKAIRFRGIDTDVRYFDPSRSAPPLETDAAPETRTPGDNRLSLDVGEGWNVVIIAVLGVLVLAILFSLGRIGTSVSFRKETKNAGRRARSQTDETEPDDQLPSDLEAILRLKDRQQALVRLSQHVLTRCLNANGVLFQRSWTEREGLRKLPSTLPHLSDIQALVLDSERVGFGGREVSDSEFEAHVSRIRPLLRSMAQ